MYMYMSVQHELQYVHMEHGYIHILSLIVYTCMYMYLVIDFGEVLNACADSKSLRFVFMVPVTRCELMQLHVL